MRSGWMIVGAVGVLCPLWALAAELPEAALPPPEIVVLGDSITKGVRPGVATAETFAALVEQGLNGVENGVDTPAASTATNRPDAPQPAVRVSNLGVGGERTDQALRRIERVVASAPRIVTIMYGTNDSYVDAGKSESRLSLEAYRQNLVELLRRLRREGATPVLMTEPRWAAGKKNGLGEDPNLRLAPYVEACRDVARQQRTPLIDHFAEWTAAEQSGQDLGEWTTDGVHPNPAGHRVMAKRMLPALQELLKGSPLAATAKLNRGDSPGLQVVCFGDSVTGLYYHTGGQQAYTDLLEIALRRLFPTVEASAINAFNAGVSGNTTANGLKRIQSDVLARRPDVVTVMFGLNDLVRVPLDDFRKNLQSIVAQCRGVGAEVVLCTPNNVITTSGRPADKLVDYCDAVRTVAREMDVTLCDVHRELQALRAVDELSWRLLMSDEIHPNMDGHKRIAELLAKAIAGQSVSVADVRAPADPLEHVRRRIQRQQPVKVIAMAPVAQLLETALGETFPDSVFEITVWETAGKSLGKLEQEARDTVRAAKPDLVALAIPPGELTEDWAALRSYTWIMNWSLSFGRQEWDCIVVHPRVLEPRRGAAEATKDALIRRLVLAQHLPLVDRAAGDSRAPLALLRASLERQRRQPRELAK